MGAISAARAADEQQPCNGGGQSEAEGSIEVVNRSRATDDGDHTPNGPQVPHRKSLSDPQDFNTN